MSPGCSLICAKVLREQVPVRYGERSSSMMHMKHSSSLIGLKFEIHCSRLNVYRKKSQTNFGRRQRISAHVRKTSLFQSSIYISFPTSHFTSFLNTPCFLTCPQPHCICVPIAFKSRDHPDLSLRAGLVRTEFMHQLVHLRVLTSGLMLILSCLVHMLLVLDGFVGSQPIAFVLLAPGCHELEIIALVCILWLCSELM